MTNNITAIIVDDEEDAVKLLRNNLRDLYPNIDIIGTFTVWQKALEALKHPGCDLLFIDISMPGKNGFELLKLVPGLESEIIFVTAHDNFALDAFGFSATGYILKPIDDEELSAAVNKALERINSRKRANTSQFAGNGSSEKIGIPDKKGTEYVSIGDILYIEAMNGCTKVVTANGEIISAHTLGRFKSVLENKGFFLLHRSFMVNINCIKRYTSEGMVVLNNGKEIPVSKNYRDDFLLIFNKISKAV